MNAVQRSRTTRQAYIITDGDGCYLARPSGIWRWTNARDDAKVFQYYGSACRRAALAGGVVVPRPTKEHHDGD